MTANLLEVKVPDIGGTTDAEVIEILVKPGQTIGEDDSIITLESDKASMEVPSSTAGTVEKVHVGVGDKVAEGNLILTLKSQSSEKTSPVVPPQSTETVQASTETGHTDLVAVKSDSAPASTQPPPLSTVTIGVPDIGDVSEVEVIEIAVAKDDRVDIDQTLVTVEGDKATMDIPSTHQGKITQLLVKLGDKVSQGTPLVDLEASVSLPEQTSTTVVETNPPVAEQSQATQAQTIPTTTLPTDVIQEAQAGSEVYASPSVRRLARELGVVLSEVQGSGRKHRIIVDDIRRFVKSRLSGSHGVGGATGIPPIPVVDFEKFGPVQRVPLNKIKRLTAQHMQRAWLNIPHVTQFDEADITDTEAFRQSNKVTADGVKITILSFVVLAVVRALKQFPQFNASLDASGESLVIKQHYHIGIAVDTPNGLVVPVIKNADQQSLAGIAEAMSALSQKARDGKLLPGEMAGGSFSISSLGGVGGTAFTPIINAPEVAILGLSRSYTKPVYQNGVFEPRLTLPLSLSYDHRVIDGAEAARFTAFLGGLLSDTRRILL